MIFIARRFCVPRGSEDPIVLTHRFYALSVKLEGERRKRFAFRILACLIKTRLQISSVMNVRWRLDSGCRPAGSCSVWAGFEPRAAGMPFDVLLHTSR